MNKNISALEYLYNLQKQRYLEDYQLKVKDLDVDDCQKRTDLQESLGFRLYCLSKQLERDLADNPEYPEVWETAFQRLEADLDRKYP